MSARCAVRLTLAGAVSMLLAGWTPASASGVEDEPCPAGAIAVEPGDAIQQAVDRAGEGAAFCLKNGIHRLQSVRPRPRQRFYGEGRTVLNGSRVLVHFERDGELWFAPDQWQRGVRRGECATDSPACNLPNAIFIDDRPLAPVLAKAALGPGRFYFDQAAGRIYLADDPAGHKVEAAVDVFAFESREPDVLIKNMTIEKYATIAQKGAVQAQEAAGWIIENCEIRLNSAAGIAAGSRTRIESSDIHHNGQIGVTGVGRDILVQNNDIWDNNTRGFFTSWEAGGLKLALSDHVVLRANRVHGNRGAGLWCDIECRDVLYEGNVVERNRGAGIFHEISYSAVIRDNVLRHNGLGKRGAFWRSNNILVAASQDVEVFGNTITVDPGSCGIILLDQGRRNKMGGTYKTRNNNIHNNVTTFEGTGCAGAVVDTAIDSENATIIQDGDNRFDANVYRFPSGDATFQFAWGHAEFGWDEVRLIGVERHGKLILH